MKALQQRAPDAGLAFHQKSEVRVYADDDIQRDRIERARRMVDGCVSDSSGKFIIELGCGTCDISGPFSTRNTVSAYDCNAGALLKAVERFPSLRKVGPVPEEPESCDVLIVCEFLEHLADPHALVKAWLPLAQQVVISHPLNGDINGDLSAGEHQWSYDEADFRNWFSIGGHELIAHDVFRMGGYQIILGRGKKAA